MNDFYSFMMLGKYGRLGNQMFQVAATACLARRKGVSLVLPNDDSVTVRKYFDIPCEDLSDSHLRVIRARWEEKNFSHNPQIDDVPVGSDILGYLQSWKYITDEDFVRKIFTFKKSTIQKSKSRLPSGPLIAIHVRRGDYLKYPDVHPLPTIDYYQSGLKIVKEKSPSATPVIFTDDVAWCKQNFPQHLILSGHEDEDMCAMSLCDHIITANSSYSWWASWLTRKDATIISPDPWFGPKGPQDTQDLLPFNYMRIKCF